MGTYLDLINTRSGNDFFLAPAPDGSPRGWKVEYAIPSTGSNVIGTAIVGTARIEAPSWVALTPYFAGCDLQIGSADGGNEVTVMNLVLDDKHDMFSPWRNAYAGPNTIVRVSTYEFGAAPGTGLFPGATTYPGAALPAGIDPYHWEPLFTGITESWSINAVSIDGVRTVNAVVVGMVSLLARINDKALAAVVGNGDTTDARIRRLLDASGWPYGYNYLPSDSTGYTHQSTVMAANRLTELYLTADSAGMVFRAAADGKATLAQRAWSFQTIDASAVIADGTLQISNDGDIVINTVTLAIANDPAGERTFTNAPLITQFGVRSYKRDDLNLSIGSDTSLVAADILGRGNAVMRVTSFVLDNIDNIEAELLIRSLRPGLGVNVRNIPGTTVTCETCFVAQITHSITPRGPSDIAWQSTYSLLPSAVMSQ